MSTFLTQTAPSSSAYSQQKASGKGSSSLGADNQQLHSALLYAPFIKPQDKVKKDVADVSFSDFQPKRFALNYDPPMLSK